MRLPLSKVYRAFPELDPFSDDRCEAYVATARGRHQASEVGVAVLAVVVSIGSAVVLVPLLVRLARAFFGLIPSLLSVDGRTDLALALGGGGAVVASVMIGFVIRDFWLRWAIRTCLRIARCTCGYSLLGLRVSDGAVTCPECGHRLDLAAAGLTEADLLARPDDDHPTSASPSDSP